MVGEVCLPKDFWDFALASCFEKSLGIYGDSKPFVGKEKMKNITQHFAGVSEKLY